MRGLMEFAKIVLLSIFAAIVYGIVHDQFTARICLEYFTVFHPQIFPTQSPTLLAFGWGILPTWWVGAFLGLLLALAAPTGSKPKLTARAVFPFVARLLLVMAACAFVARVVGYFTGPTWLDRSTSVRRPNSPPRRYQFHGRLVGPQRLLYVS